MKKLFKLFGKLFKKKKKDEMIVHADVLQGGYELPLAI